MSWKNITSFALSAMLAVPALAAPSFTGTTANYDNATGQWIWSVQVSPDAALFAANPPNGTGGSVALEAKATVTGAISAAANATNFPNPNPGSAGPQGVSAPAAGVVTANLGSTYFTTGGGKEALTIAAPGPAVAGAAVLGNSTTTTLTIDGAYNAAGAAGTTHARIAQAGQNFSVNGTFSRKVYGGDANLSGGATPVTIADLSILAGNINKPGTFRWHQGDFNGSGTVTVADLALLAANINKPLAPGAAGGSAVPEPASVALIGLALAGMIGFIRRK